jgi:hypothetical protein
MARPAGGYIAGYVAPTIDTARGVWSLRDVYPGLRADTFPAKDPAFSNVLLSLHGEGTNNSTTITDSSSYARTMTAAGSAVISTTRSRFGSASISLPTASSAVTAASSSDFTLGTGDFTIEFWVWLSTTSASQGLVASGGAANTGSNLSWAFFTAQTGTINYYLSSNGSAYNIAGGVLAGNFAAQTWTHVALVRSGTTFSPYINGARGTTTTSSSSIYWASTGGGVQVGFAGSAGNFSGIGNYDEVRITKAARYSGASFALQNGVFPDR